MKKFLSAILTLSLVLSISAIAVWAYNPPKNSARVYLSSNETGDSTTEVLGTYKYIGGQVYSYSKRKITYCPQFFDASSNSWMNDYKISYSAGSSFDDKITRKFAATVAWKLYIRPYAPYSDGASGEGYIYLNQTIN